MHRISICCAVMALAICAPSMAQDQLSYNKVEAGTLVSTITDSGGDDNYGVGFDVNGSWEFAAHAFGFGEISGIAYQYDDGDSGYDYAIASLELGLGINAPLAPNLDLVMGLSFRRTAEDFDPDDDEGAYTSNGFGLNAGLRGLAGRRFAWEAGLKYGKLKYAQFDLKYAITSLKAGFRFQFTRLFAAGADLRTDGYDTGFHLAADEVILAAMFRLQFDDRDGSPQWK